MKMSEYQATVAVTMNHALSQPQALSNYALGLAGEAQPNQSNQNRRTSRHKQRR